MGGLLKAAKATKEPAEVQVAIYAHEFSARRKIGQWLGENVTHDPTGNKALPVGVSKMDSHRWQLLAKVEEPMCVTGIEALKPYRYFYKLAKDADVGTGSGTFKLGVGRFQDCKIKNETVDLIITDPPYPEKYLSEWSDLSAFAARVLKPGGSLLAMSGQTHLPEVIRRLDESMTYQWMLAYLTPGGQSAQVFPRKVNPFWKPVLWYVKGEYEGDWIGDVIKSPTNQNEKDSHEWQQSFGGMTDLVKRFLRKGQVLCDPFCGSGTTGIAAMVLNMDVHFLGIDVDADAIAVATERLERCQR